MLNDDMLYIQDANKNTLSYRFTPAAIASNFIPLIVIIDNEDDLPSTHFEYKMWNVLSLIRPFDKELLQELISQISLEHECEEHIYMYAKGEDPYETIMQGVLCKANAVFVDVSTREGQRDAKDFENCLKGLGTFPVFYLYDNLFLDKKTNTLNEEMRGFINSCKKHDIKVHLNTCIPSQGDAAETVKEVLNFFERMKSQ